MLFRRLAWAMAKVKSTSFSAQKYMKSVTETALLYRPEQMVQLTPEDNIKDRVVLAFFDSSNYRINVSEAANRLTAVSDFSTPSHSFYQIKLPFEQNLTLRRRMTQFSSSNIRVGRLLELMDYIAANVAYRYCTTDQAKQIDLDSLEFIVVTAAIDQIEFYYPISNETDCLLSGYVSYVGTSSMEVHIDVLQTFEGTDRLACSANFVMVARNQKTGKSYAVPKLSLEAEREKFRIINEMGQLRQLGRRDEAKRGLEMAPPTYEESVVIHNLIKKLKEGSVECYRSISSTITKNNLLMHIEDKNLSGKIFGGHILRVGYEVGWLCASKFLTKTLPTVTEIDEVQFLAPVEVGSFVELTASIAYVTDRFLHVIVTCDNSSLKGDKVRTNILHITFQHQEQAQVPRVYPQSLKESYLYIQALRRVQKLGRTEP